MTPRKIFAAAVLSAAITLTAACGKDDDGVADARNRIFSALKSLGVYERGNLPDDPEPTYDQIKGYYDIVGGAYRFVVNEDRAGRPASGSAYEIRRGDRIAFMFDARVFTGGTFESQQTFYTNIESRMTEIEGNNTGFEGWPTDPFEITVGEDPSILRSLQEALISCRAGDGDPDNDDRPDGIASDRVRVWLTSDIAFGNKTVYNVPRGSTIVFEVTEIVKK